MSEPKPFKERRDLPPELRDALRVLGKQDVHSARLDRVASRLGPWFDAPPGAQPSAPAAFLRSARPKLLLARWGAAALAIGVSAVWFVHTHAPRVATSGAQLEVPPVVEPQQTAATSAPMPGVALRAEPVVPDAVVPDAVVPAVVPASRGAADAVMTSAADRAAARASRHRRASNVRRHPVAVLSVSSEASLVAPSAAVITDTPAADTAPAVQPPEPEQAVPPATPPRGEAELLFAARKAKRSDPKEALVLVAEHEARFPDGALREEREVLAIQVLRELGQRAAADRRLAAFRGRYPDSLHLPRLERTAH